MKKPIRLVAGGLEKSDSIVDADNYPILVLTTPPRGHGEQIAQVANGHGEEIVQAVNDRDAFVAVAEACRMVRDLACWMSGSADFAPGGKAYEGWLKLRPAISQASDALALAGIGRQSETIEQPLR